MKVKEIMQRQGELAGKIAKGEATEADYEELKRLNQMIADAQAKAEKPVEKMETELDVVSVEEFQKYCEWAEKSDDERVLALLQENIARVEAQKAKGKEMFAIELPVEKEEQAEPTMIDVMAAIADLKDSFEKKFTTDGRTVSGLREDADEDEEETSEQETEKADSVAQSLALEGLDKWLAGLQVLRDKVEAGTVTMDDVSSSFYGNWELREAIENAIAVMAKMSDLVEALGVITPALQDLEKTESEKAEPAEDKTEEGEESKEEKSEEDNAEESKQEKAEESKEEEEKSEDSEDKAGEDEEPKEEDAEKTEKSRINWDGDLAAGMGFKTLEEEYAHFRKANNR